MIAKVLGWIIVSVVAVALVRALWTGVMEFDPGGKGYMSARMDKEPVAFWTIFSMCAAAVAYFIWLLLG